MPSAARERVSSSSSAGSSLTTSTSFNREPLRITEVFWILRSGAHWRSAGLQILRLDDLTFVFPLGDNENVGFLRPLIAAGLILTGSSGSGRQHARSRGESR